MLTKEEILKEIKRTTEENGGKPLGYTNFRNETGIKSWDWGRYWTKWGDALEEAGYKRNAAWTKHPEGVLEEDAIKLIRKLGKYFSKGEMRVEYMNNPDFHYSAIDKKIKRDFVDDLVKYCEQRKGYEDILQICRPILEDLDSKKQVDESSKDITPGEVYMAKHGTRHYKIGFTTDVMRRGKEISILLPEKLTLIHSIKTDDPSGVEAYWHKRFEDKRMNGEWFSLNSQDIRAFKKWKRIF